MNLPELKYPIPSDILTSTIEAMRDYSRLLEAEAAALAKLKSPEAEKYAQERLEDAEVAKKLFEFYLNCRGYQYGKDKRNHRLHHFEPPHPCGSYAGTEDAQ